MTDFEKKKYYCKFCNYTTDVRQNWYQHNKGKKHLKNVQIAEQNNQKVNHKDNVIQCKPNVTPPYDAKVDTISTENIDLKTVEKKHVCPHCNKIFSTRQAKYKHIKNSCNIIKAEEEEKKKLEFGTWRMTHEDNQKFIMQFFEKQAEKQRKWEEKQRKWEEKQRKWEEKVMQKSGNNTDLSENHHKHCLDLQLTSEYKLEHRPEDGYINVTGLCLASGKLLNDWYRLEKTKAFIEILSNDTGISISKLIYKGKGGKKKSQSWVHPQVAVNIAQWISPEFNVLVSKWVYEIMATSGVHVYNTKPYKELDELNKTNIKRIKELESKYLKKQKSKNYKKNVVYLLTTKSLEKDRRYIIGKAENLKARLSVYNKTDEHTVIHHVSCSTSTIMGALETMILTKLNNYKELPNRDRFILPQNKNISFFIKLFDDCYNYIEDPLEELQPEEEQLSVVVI